MTSSGGGHGAGLPQPPPGRQLAFASAFPLVWEAAGNSQGCRNGAFMGSGSSFPGSGTYSLEQARGGGSRALSHKEVGTLRGGESSPEGNSVSCTAGALGRALSKIRLSRQT